MPQSIAQYTLYSKEESSPDSQNKLSSAGYIQYHGEKSYRERQIEVFYTAYCNFFDESGEVIGQFEGLTERLQEIADLIPNWDGQGGAVPSNTVLRNSFMLLEVLPSHYKELLSVDDITPSSHGTISFDWVSDDENTFVSVEIGKFSVGFFAKLPEEEMIHNDRIKWEGKIPTELLTALEKFQKDFINAE